MLTLLSLSSLLTPCPQSGGLYFPRLRRELHNNFIFPHVDMSATCLSAPGGHGLTTLARVLSTHNGYRAVCVNGYCNPGAPNAGVDTDHESLPLTPQGNGRFEFRDYPDMPADRLWRTAILSAVYPARVDIGDVMSRERFERIAALLRSDPDAYARNLKAYDGPDLRLIVDFRASGVHETPEMFHALGREILELERINPRLRPLLFLDEHVLESVQEDVPTLGESAASFAWTWDNLFFLFAHTLDFCGMPHPMPEPPREMLGQMMEHVEDVFPPDRRRIATPEAWLYQRLRDGHGNVRVYDFLVYMQFLITYSPRWHEGVLDAHALAQAEAAAGWAPIRHLRNHRWAYQALQVLRSKLVPLHPDELAEIWQRAFVAGNLPQSPLAHLQQMAFGRDVDTWAGLTEQLIRFGFMSVERDGERLSIPRLYRQALGIGLRGGCRVG